MSVGFRPHDVAGSDIVLGAALDGLRGPKANECLHERKVMPDRLMPGTWHGLIKFHAIALDTRGLEQSLLRKYNRLVLKWIRGYGENLFHVDPNGG